MIDRLEAIAEAPFASHPDCRHLVGVRDGFRLRQGNWRALYRVDRQAAAIFVEDVRHRKDAYR